MVFHLEHRLSLGELGAVIARSAAFRFATVVRHLLGFRVLLTAVLTDRDECTGVLRLSRQTYVMCPWS